MKKTFREEGDFASVYKAEKYLKENGYSYGSMCGDEPIAIMKGDVLIAKWKNLSTEERRKIDGIMTSEDFRGGSVVVEIFK